MEQMIMRLKKISKLIKKMVKQRNNKIKIKIIKLSKERKIKNRNWVRKRDKRMKEKRINEFMFYKFKKF